MNKPTCSFNGCANPSRSRGWCDSHYKQWYRGEELRPLAECARPAPLQDRFWKKVQKGPGCWEWTASKLKGHGRIGAGRKSLYAHRVSWEMANGPIPEGMEIDHKCHNRGCVNPDHLRVVTPKQNNENRAGLNPNNTSGISGVSWNKASGNWQVTIRHHNKTIYVGRFDDIEEAGEAARLKRNELFTHNDNDRKAA